MGYTKKLVGDQVYLSPRTASDEEVQKFTEWMNDFQVTDYIASSSSLISAPSEREWLESSAKNFKDRLFNIVALNDDCLLGSISLDQIDSIHRSATLGIFIGDSNYRGKGIGTEAVNLILEYGFRYLNLHSIQLEVLSANKRAIKCYEKCGFKKTGQSRERLFIDGKYYDNVHMDILDHEFKGSYIRNKNL